MSDEQIREAERSFRSGPTDVTALALGRARARGGEEGIRVFKILTFVKELKSWKLAVRDLEQTQMSCRECGGSGLFGQYEGKCDFCCGTGWEPFDRGGPLCLVNMPEVNKLFPYLSRGFIVGRWRSTPTGLLKWAGE